LKAFYGDTSMKREKGNVVWPQYLDSTRTRSLGRRLPKELAVERPRLDEVVKAAERLKLSFEVRMDAAYPRQGWEKNGCLVLHEAPSKTELLRMLGKEIRGLRGLSVITAAHNET